MSAAKPVRLRTHSGAVHPADVRTRQVPIVLTDRGIVAVLVLTLVTMVALAMLPVWRLWY